MTKKKIAPKPSRRKRAAEPDCFAALGPPVPPAEAVKNLRRHIDEDLAELRELLVNSLEMIPLEAGEHGAGESDVRRWAMENLVRALRHCTGISNTVDHMATEALEAVRVAS